jgi:hypothetical protein
MCNDITLIQCNHNEITKGFECKDKNFNLLKINCHCQLIKTSCHGLHSLWTKVGSIVNIMWNYPHINTIYYEL